MGRKQVLAVPEFVEPRNKQPIAAVFSSNIMAKILRIAGILSHWQPLEKNGPIAAGQSQQGIDLFHFVHVH